MHIAALLSNTNMDDPENHRDERIQEIEISYDEIKDMIWSSGRKVNESSEPESDFMRAGRRSLARIAPPVLPGEEAIARLPE